LSGGRPPRSPWRRARYSHYWAFDDFLDTQIKASKGSAFTSYVFTDGEVLYRALVNGRTVHNTINWLPDDQGELALSSFERRKRAPHSHATANGDWTNAPPARSPMILIGEDRLTRVLSAHLRGAPSLPIPSARSIDRRYSNC